MSKDSKQTSESQNIQLPKAPSYVTNGFEAIANGVLGLGNKNPQSMVAGINPMLAASFNGGNSIAGRYGWNSGGPSVQVGDLPHQVGGGGGGQGQVGGSSGGGQGLLSGLGSRTPDNFTYDWQAIGADRAGREPSFQQAYDSLTPQQHRDILNVLPDGDGNLSLGDFARFHHENGPPISDDMEARFRELSGGKTGNPGFGGGPGVVDMGGGRFGSGPSGGMSAFISGGSPGGGQSYSPFGGSPTAQNANAYNPLSAYAVAGQAGPNTYNAAGYNPTTMNGSGIYELLMNNAGSEGAGGASASAGKMSRYIDDFMNPYTDSVVDSTLAAQDRYDLEQQANSRAQAAANGAFGGSRDAIRQADLLARQGLNRALTESDMRRQGFNTALGAAGQQVGMDNQVGMHNASLRQQAQQAAADREQSRLFAATQMMFNEGLNNMNAFNQAGQFNANAQNTAGQFNANQRDDALSRQLSAAQQYQNNERADLGLFNQLGQQQRQIEGQQRNADVGLLATMVDLFGSLPFGQVTGYSNTGRTTQTQTPGIMDWINAGIGATNSFTDMRNSRQGV